MSLKGHRIIGVLDFVHRPKFQILKNTKFRKLDLFLSSGEGGETPTLLVRLERADLNHWTTHVKSSHVILRPTAVGQFVFVSDPFGAHDQILIFFVWQLLSFFFM
jgi:hypothetical protein